MIQYCLLLLTVTAVRAWSISHGNSESKEDANSMYPKNADPAHSWMPDDQQFYRIGRSAYRGRELFGKRSPKLIASPEDRHQRLFELLEQGRGNNELILSNDDNELSSLVLEPEFWIHLNEYYRYLYGPDSFQRERRRRHKQRELFG
uniref:Short neuropeptide F n=1 Tax=Syphacia muris TaxID=451379 RepID=A0A0N5AYY7_9BILA